MAVNNEIGVIQPLQAIGSRLILLTRFPGEICRSAGVFFHTDAAQAFGKIPLDVEEMKIDAMSISGHKIYGPKGVGALFMRRRPRVRAEALLSGGGQVFSHGHTKGAWVALWHPADAVGRRHW